MPNPPLTLTDGLVQLSFLVQARLGQVAAAHDLSVTQLRLLGILRDRQPGLRELAGYLELEKSSLTGLVDRAELRGLVERVPSATDRRASNVRLTPQGRQLARQGAAVVNADVAQMLSGISKADHEKLRGLIERVIGETAKPIDAA